MVRFRLLTLRVSRQLDAKDNGGGNSVRNISAETRMIIGYSLDCPINPTTYHDVVAVSGGTELLNTTIARFRSALAPHFEPTEFDSVTRRCREAGLIEAGTGGRNGVGSAPLELRQTVLLLLALSCDADPIDAPSEAVRVGSFKLLRHDRTHISEPEQRVAFENQHLDLLTALSIEIERFDDDRPPSCWAIAARGCCQIAPDRLVFGESLETLTDPADPDCVVRSCTIPGRLLADIAELFHAKRAEAAD